MNLEIPRKIPISHIFFSNNIALPDRIYVHITQIFVKEALMIIFNLPLSEFDHREEILLNELKERGYSNVTILNYQWYLSLAKQYLLSEATDMFTNEDMEQFFTNYCDKNHVQSDGKRKYRAVIRRFNSQCEGREWIQTIGYRKNLVFIPVAFEGIIRQYLEKCSEIGNKPITVNRKRQYSEEFVSKLNDLGCDCPDKMSPDNVLAACMSFTFTGSWPFIAQFLTYLFEVGTIDCDLSTFVPKHQRKQLLPQTYSEQEICAAENSIDTTTVAGMRNLAIFTLASRCGLRCGDIVLLRTSDISLDTGYLSIIQQKTDVPLKLTLPAVVIDAIRKYLTYARGENSTDILFLSTLPPFGSLKPSSVYRVVKRAFDAAGIDTSNKKSGPHALRASLATSMVNDDVPYDAVRKILGHENPQTVRHYASVHVEKLREYALTPPNASGNFLSILKGGQ